MNAIHGNSERQCPCTRRGVAEYVVAFLAHVVFNSYYGLAVLQPGIGQVGSHGSRLCADAVVFEESEVIFVYLNSRSVGSRLFESVNFLASDSKVAVPACFCCGNTTRYALAVTGDPPSMQQSIALHTIF